MSQQHKPLNYQIFGDDSSPKLVFLHGIMGQGRNWMSIAKKFARHFQCLIFDQRGHGKSFHPETGFEVEDYVQDLKELKEELGWTAPIHLVGHSMGGRVALVYASLYPQDIEKLVIVDIGPQSDWSSFASILEKLDFVPTPFNSREEARHFFEGEFLQRYSSPMLMEFFYSNLSEQNGQYHWIFSKKAIRQTLERARDRDYWAEFKNLSTPSLFIRGEHSTDLKREDFERVLSHNSKIQGREVMGAGHWVHAEKPRETLKIIEDFFDVAGGRDQC